MRKDNLPAGNTPRGWILVSYNGINLGFMKNVGNRINNYYPIGWRVRMNPADSYVINLIKWAKVDPY